MLDPWWKEYEHDFGWLDACAHVDEYEDYIETWKDASAHLMDLFWAVEAEQKREEYYENVIKNMDTSAWDV